MLYKDLGIYHYSTRLYQLIFESYQSKEEELDKLFSFSECCYQYPVLIYFFLKHCMKSFSGNKVVVVGSLVFLKFPACLYNSTMHSDAFFISLLIYNLRSLSKIHARNWLKSST